ncbi:MAG: hypothetical protein LQ350_004840 [Teloschistes chrysophthalmus]|nr:MAG: hypothetical protein LQ350_004840 [Niorma chrysophthalma]
MQNNSTYEQELAIVYRERNGRATLVPLTIDSTGSGRQIFERIRDKQREMSALHGRLTSLLLLLAQYEVAIAEIRWTLYSTSENKNDGIRVDLGNRRKDDLLTEALYNPHLLTNEPAFILKHDNLVLQRKDESEDGLALALVPDLVASARNHCGQRTFADTKKPDTEPKASIQDSDTVVFPGSQSQTAKGPLPPAPGAVPPVSATSSSPATPSSDSIVPPQNIPLIPPQPPGGNVQTAPPTSIPPTTTRQTDALPPKTPTPSDTTSAPPPSAPPPQPPPQKPKSRRFRRFLLGLILLSGFGFAGGTYYSLLSDNFHDFFTEYVPFGEDAVLYFEEREFRRRFPNMTNPTNRPNPPTNTITIPSKSGLSWKVSDESEKGSNLETKGRHMSALDSNQPKTAKDNAQQAPAMATKSEKVGAVEQAKKDAPAPPAKPEPAKEIDPKKDPAPASKEPKTPPKAQPSQASAPNSAPSPSPAFKPEDRAKEPAFRPPEVNEPSRIMPTPRIDPLKIQGADEPIVQDLVKIINDLITVINADNAQTKYQAPIRQAKSGVASIGDKIMGMKQAERTAAQDKIKATQAEFEDAARELVRRLEEELRNQTAAYRDEFESEREKVSQRYGEQLETEIKRAQEVSDQRLRNELLEQAVALKKTFISDVQSQVETERSGRLSKLSSLSSSIEELESLTSSWNKVIDNNLDTQHLLLAVEAVRATLENANRPRPFVSELATLKELATSDPVISSAIASINPTAYQRGVPTTSQLIDRFRRVASEVRKASLLPEDAGVASHAASLVLSRVMFKKKGMTVGDDVESVLTRTETLLEEGRLDEAAREMNCLDGWAKSLSADWLGEVRKVLEVRQAVDVMGTQARLLGLGVE